MKSHTQNLSLPLPFETNIQQKYDLCKYHFFVIHHKEMKNGYSSRSIQYLLIFKKSYVIKNARESILDAAGTRDRQIGDLLLYSTKLQHPSLL